MVLSRKNSFSVKIEIKSLMIRSGKIRKNKYNLKKFLLSEYNERKMFVPRRLFFAAQQRKAITWRPKYYQKMRCFITRKNQKEYGPDVK
jgi:hypothetical protein